MKKISFRKLTLLVVSIFMMSVFVITAVSFKSFKVYAEPEKTQEKASTKKQKRPTYTETLESNNELLTELKDYLDKSKAKPKWYEYKLDKNALIKKSGEATASIVKIVTAVAKENQDFNYGTEVYNIAKTMITGALSGTVYGAAAEALFAVMDVINTAVASGEAPLSEVQVMQDKMFQEFDKMASDIHKVQDEVSALSTKLSKSVELILDGTESVVAASDSKKRIERFYSRSEGNFSFTEFKNFLYGSTDYTTNRYSSKAYYNQYIDAKITNKPTELIEKYLNQLYINIEANIGIYEDYIQGNKQAGIKPIVQEYYDYLCSNEQLTKGSTAEYLAIEFASDVYKTQAYAHELLALCYEHMINSIQLEAAYEGIDVTNENSLLAKEYYYTKNDSITYHEVENGLLETIYNSDMSENVVDDLSYILGLEDSYVVSYKEGQHETLKSLYTETEAGNTYINIIPGSKVYLNLLGNDILSMFGLCEDDFIYYMDSTPVSKEEFGIIDSSECAQSQNVSIYYKDTLVYSLFINSSTTDNYVAGQGTKNDPYLIANEAQFRNMIDEINDTTEKNGAYHSYKLVDDINFNYGIISPIGTENHPFNGTFDGNGHVIRNLKVLNPSRSSDELGLSTTGLFGTIGTEGSVKDLTITNYYVTSAYSEDGIEPSDDAKFIVGGLAGHNYGNISNVTINKENYDNFIIDVNRIKNDRNSRQLTVVVGGICGLNEGFISNCTIDGLKMNVFTDHNSHGETNTSENRQIVYAGGCVGVNCDTLEFVRIQNSSILIDVNAKSNIQDKTFRPEIDVKYAGLIASAESTKFEHCYANVEMDYSIKLENDASFSLFERYKEKYSFQNVSVETGTYCSCHIAVRDDEEWNEFELEKFSHDSEVLKYQSEYINEIYRYNSFVLAGEKFKNDPVKYSAYLSTFVFNPARYPHVLDFALFIIEYTVMPTQVLPMFKTDVKNYLIDKYKEIDDEAFISQNIDGYIYTGKAESFDSAHMNGNQKDYTIIIEYLDENNNVINDENYIESYLPGSAYNNTNKKFYIQWNGETTKTELDVSDILVYKFSTYKDVDDFTSADKDIELLLLTKYNNEKTILKCNQKIKVLGNKIINVEVSDFIKSEFDKGNGTEAEIQQMRETILNHPFIVTFTYLTGGSKTIIINSSFDSVLTIEGLTNEFFGKQTIILSIEELNLVIEAEIVISCDHEYGLEETIIGDCQNYTYEQKVCTKCGNEYKYNLRLGSHDYVYENTPVTCKNAGTVKHVKCSICNLVFEKGEVIQALGHNFIEIPSDKVNDKYDSKFYHWCSNAGCGEYELHDYKVTEGVFDNQVFYTYECIECHHKETIIDSNIIPSDDETIIYVTDGYYIHKNDKVTVYVQLVNPVNFSSALFGIRYSDGLKLDSYKVGNEIPNMIKEANPVKNGINFAWVDVKKHNVESYLLKLVFEIEDYQDEYTVDVVYGIDNFFGENTKQGFMVNGVKTQFITRAGVISRVNQLPGDVNKDGKVNLFDAQLLAWKEIGTIVLPTKEDELQNYPYDFSKKNADINHDGELTIDDIEELLQAIYGYSGISLRKNDYKLYLNLNGFVTDDIPETLDISYYLDDDKISTWADIENENFSLDSISKLERDGYTFAGWYTRLVGGKEITISKNMNIFYDLSQKKQTLYARWELNKITLVIDGEEENIFYKPNNISQDENENVLIEVEHPTTKEYSVTFEIYKKSESLSNLTKTTNAISSLDGWMNGEKFVALSETFNLVTPNTQITLNAVWSDYELSIPSFKDSKQDYYDEISGFVYSDNGETFNLSDERIQEGKAFTVKHVLVPTRYQIVFDKNIDESDVIKFDDDDSIKLEEANLFFTVESDTLEISGLKDINHYKFAGWRLVGTESIKNDVAITTSNFNKYLSDGKIKLVANWNPKVYTITIHGMNNNYGNYQIKNVYYPYGSDRLYSSETCNDPITVDKSFISSNSSNSSFLSNFAYGGLYLNTIYKNGTPDAASSVQIINPFGKFAITKGKSYFDDHKVIYAKYTPNSITLSINPKSRGLVETSLISDAMGLASYTESGHNMSLIYSPSNNSYSLRNSSTNDPYCVSKEYMILKKNQTYYMHLETTGSIQVFYGLNGAFNETNSLRFTSSQKTHTFTVSEDGRYLIRFDSDSSYDITAKNFYVDTYEWDLNVTYTFGQKLTVKNAPSSKYYNPKFKDGLTHTSGHTYYLNNCQFTTGKTLELEWTEKKNSDFNYVSNLEEFKQMMSTFDKGSVGKYMLVHDINYNGGSITPVKELKSSGYLDGDFHQVYNFEIIVNKEGSDTDNRVGLFSTNRGAIRNLVIGSYETGYKNTISLTYKNTVDGAAQVSSEYLRNYVGAIAGYNYSTIDYCTVQNMNIIGKGISHHGGVSGKSTLVIVVVGGAIGHNASASVSDISILNCNITSNATAKYDGQVSIATGGGVLGSNLVSYSSPLSNMKVKNTTITVEGHSQCDQYYNRAYDTFANGGQIVGVISSNTTFSSITTSGNSLTVSASDVAPYSHGYVRKTSTYYGFAGTEDDHTNAGTQVV